ncbi:MAG: YraN family protein [Bryobacteraceae bacterium]
MVDLIRHKGRLRLWQRDHALGRRGEDLAHRYLQKRGFCIVARNYRGRNGGVEVDLIGWDGPILVFIEVKSRSGDNFGPPEKAVDREKQDRLIRAAGEYIHRAGVAWKDIRFDLVSVLFGEPQMLSHIEDAFRRSSPL